LRLRRPIFAPTAPITPATASTLRVNSKKPLPRTTDPDGDRVARRAGSVRNKEAEETSMIERFDRVRPRLGTPPTLLEGAARRPFEFRGDEGNVPPVSDCSQCEAFVRAASEDRQLSIAVLATAIGLIERAKQHRIQADPRPVRKTRDGCFPGDAIGMACADSTPGSQSGAVLEQGVTHAAP
jgi:hypothetical protein